MFCRCSRRRVGPQMRPNFERDAAAAAARTSKERAPRESLRGEQRDLLGCGRDLLQEEIVRAAAAAARRAFKNTTTSEPFSRGRVGNLFFFIPDDFHRFLSVFRGVCKREKIYCRVVAPL